MKISADYVVLSAGIHPNQGNKEIAQFLKVPLNGEGFFLEAHMKLRPVDFMTDGVFLCGLAHSPKTVDESIVQAQAAASRAATILSRDSIEMEANISEVVDANCDGCAYCVDTCPFKAITLLEYMWQGNSQEVGRGQRDHLQGLRLLPGYLPQERCIRPRVHARPNRGADPCGSRSLKMEDSLRTVDHRALLQLVLVCRRRPGRRLAQPVSAEHSHRARDVLGHGASQPGHRRADQGRRRRADVRLSSWRLPLSGRQS